MNDNNKKNSTIELLQFISEFMEQYRKAEAKLPYRINLMDELRISRGDAKVFETAHSRILAKLLQYQAPCEKFEIFESLIRYIVKEKSGAFGNIHVKKPEISLETDNIDVCIRDDDAKYAIIVENKINNAPDQEKQLFRYIESTWAKGFNKEQIYIIYLPQTYDTKKPDDQTLGEYRKFFAERFAILSFKEDILPWLTDKILPNVRQRDKLLASALEQYIDHLQGMFKSRDINQIINIEMKNLIKKELELSDNNLLENYQKVTKKQKEIDIVTAQIDDLKREIEKEFENLLGDWHEFLEKDYKDFNPNITPQQANVRININEHDIWVALGLEEGKFYCNVVSNPIPKEIIQKFSETKLLEEMWNGDNQRLEYLTSNTFEGLYQEGENLIKKVIDCILEFR